MAVQFQINYGNTFTIITPKNSTVLMPSLSSTDVSFSLNNFDQRILFVNGDFVASVQDCQPLFNVDDESQVENCLITFNNGNQVRVVGSDYSFVISELFPSI